MKVEIEILKKMKVVGVNSKSKSPEGLAFGKMLPFALQNKLFDKQYRVFGFNDPNPSEANAEYGYSVIVPFDETLVIPDDFFTKIYPQTKYITTFVRGVENIYGSWKELFNWAKENGYEYDNNNQWLEEHFDVKQVTQIELSQIEVKLMLPVKE